MRTSIQYSHYSVSSRLAAHMLIIFLINVGCASLLTISAHAQSIENLQLAAASYFGSANNNAYCTQTVCDAQGYIYGTGFCTSINTTANAYQKTFGGVTDVMVFKMDPTLHKVVWATYIGGLGYDCGGGIAVNETGEVFVSGYTSSQDFPMTEASDSAYHVGGSNSTFILKLSADGSRVLYSRLLGVCSHINDQFSAYFARVHVCINPKNEAFVFSQADANIYQITENAFQPNIAGLSDFVLTKLNADGAVVYSTFFGGAGIERSYDMCYANSTVYCSGTTSSSDMPLNHGRTADKRGDCFVMAFRDGAYPTPIASFVLGTDSTDVGYGLFVDQKSHSVYLSGIFGTIREDAFSLQPKNPLSGGFVARLDDGLNVVQSITTFGPNVIPTSMFVSSSNALFVAGFVNQNGTIPTTLNAAQRVSSGGFDVFLLTLDTGAKELRYGTYLGGTRNDYGQVRVLCNRQGCEQQVFVSLTTHSPDFPTTSGSIQPAKLNGVSDQPAFVVFRTLPVEVDISVEIPNSVQTGTFFPLQLRSHTSVALKTSMDIELQCRSHAFEAMDSTTQEADNATRIMYIHVPATQLDDVNAIIARLTGRTLNSSEAQSSIDIRSVRLDESICADVHTHPAVIHNTSCYQEGRAVEFRQPLAMTVFPLPLNDNPSVHIVSEDNMTVTLELFDIQGQRVYNDEIACSSSGTDVPLNLSTLAPGFYNLVVSNGTERRCQRLVKQ